MSGLSDAKAIRDSNVYCLHMVTGQLIIAKCQEVDDDKLLVTDPHNIFVIVDENGNQSSVVMPFAHSFIEKPVSYFYYRNIMTIYTPSEDYVNYYLRRVEKSYSEKDENEKDTVVEKKVPEETTGEKVIQVDFKTKKRKPSANVAPVVVETEPEPEPEGAA